MCGIAGAFSADPKTPQRALVEQIVESQIPRGPDHRAIESVEGKRSRIDLGHTRLSIIDLSADAHQPMWDAERRYAVVFNGEIYNYVELKAELTALGHEFRTKSDTEVILESFRRWGVEAFDRFNGMFAFGLFDAKDEKLRLVRDRFGVKPLYYRQEQGLIAFASSPGVLARRFELEPDLGYVARGLRYAVFDGGEAAPYAGLKALEPGTCVEATAEGGRIVPRSLRWYSLAERVERGIESLAREPIPALADRVFETLKNAVDLRFRADVPVAISLSGGLDSSSVAALSAERDVTGFSFADPEDRDSEAPVVDGLSRAKGIKIHYVRPSLDEILDAFPKTIDAQGAPFTTGSIVAQHLVFRDVRAAGFKVLLGGQGGDEIFMGYRKFQMFHHRRLRQEKRRLAAFAYLMSLVPQFIAERSKAGHYLKHRRRFDASADLDSILRLPAPREVALGLAPDEPLWNRQLRDVTETSLPTLLRYEDANSMGHGVESRLPFLDYRLVELGLSLPVAAKLRKGYGKWILREAMKGRVPDTIRLARYKRGFDVPQPAWLAGGFGALLRRTLEASLKPAARWLPETVRVDEDFSDARLAADPARFREAIGIIWLARATA